MVLGCVIAELSEIEDDGGVSVVIDDPLFITSAFAWLDDERIVTSSTNPNAPLGELIDSSVFAIVDVNNEEIERLVVTDPALNVEVTWQMSVAAGRYLIAPVLEGKGGLADIARIDLETAEVKWITRTAGLAEEVAAPVPGGILVGTVEPPGMSPQLEFVPDLGPSRVVLRGKRIDTIQVVGDWVVLGGSDEGAAFGTFKVWRASLADLETGLQLTELTSGSWRFPSVEKGGETMLLTRIPGSPGDPAAVIRQAISLDGVPG